MFEQLDDPTPPSFGDGFMEAVVRRARERRRRRLLTGGGVAVAVLMAGTGALYGWAAWRVGRLDRVEVAGTGPVAGGDPVTVLVLGAEPLPDTSTPAVDVLLLARLDPGSGTAALLSVPRDLRVDDADGAAPLAISQLRMGDQVEVIESRIGVPVDHVVRIETGALGSLVDRIGGIELRVAAPMRDTASGLALDGPGCVRLDGEQVVALVRSRRTEILDASGTWRRGPLADLHRIDNQRQVVLAGLGALARVGADPVALADHVDWALDAVTVDAALGVADAVRLTRAAVGIDPAAVSQATLPVVSHPDDPNRLAVDQVHAPAVVDAFVGGRPLPEPAAPALGVEATAPFDGPLVTPC